MYGLRVVHEMQTRLAERLYYPSMYNITHTAGEQKHRQRQQK